MSAEAGETLGWEAQQRPRVVTAALLGGLLTLAGNIMSTVLLNGTPTEEDGFISVTEALGARLEGRGPEGASLLVRQVDYYGDNVGPLIGAAVLTALSTICAGLVLLYLYRATLARAPQVGRIPLYAVLAGMFLFPIGHLVRQIVAWTNAASFEDARTRTAQSAVDALQQPATVTGGLIESLGTFSLALAFVLIGLNAMRAGLLTRFLGVLAIIAGAVTVIGLDQPGLIRGFWLVAVGLMLAGRTRSGLLPAWQTGRAEPWPSQQQLRERRDAARGVTAPAPSGDAPSELAGAPQRRKRKKRR